MMIEISEEVAVGRERRESLKGLHAVCARLSSFVHFNFSYQVPRSIRRLLVAE